MVCLPKSKTTELHGNFHLPTGSTGLTRIKIQYMNNQNLKVPTMAEMAGRGEAPEILFWVGCAGSFDSRAQKITRAVVKILNHCNISFAVLGIEESCNGDPA